MSQEYHSPSVPVVVTSFAYVDAYGKPERLYYIVKLSGSDVFLKNTMRMLAKKSWTTKLKKAALFDTSEKARQTVSRSFNQVTFDL